MKKILTGLFLQTIVFIAAAQSALPIPAYLTLRDSTTSLDVVLYQGKGGSMSLDGKNVQLFNTFFDYTAAQKPTAAAAGNIMWLINGREFISGNFFPGDSTGAIVFQYKGKEYCNRINAGGNSFLKSQIKQ